MIDFILHINEHLEAIVREYGSLVYAFLFIIIFIETGLVIIPFLPGDSLLFAAGALCANQATGLNILIVIPLLVVAAIAGDNSNYAIGKFAGSKISLLRFRGRQLVKEEYVQRTHSFFDKHGTKAIIMARFVPIIRTFTPFVAGLSGMNYRKKFLPFDIAGGLLWISTMTISGYVFGQMEWVKKHFEAVVILIILISLLPMLFSYLGRKKS